MIEMIISYHTLKKDQESRGSNILLVRDKTSFYLKNSSPFVL